MKAVLLAPTPPPAGGIAGWTARMLKADLPGGWSLINVDEKAIGEREVFGQAGKRHMLEEARRCRRIWKGLRQALKDGDKVAAEAVDRACHWLAVAAGNMINVISPDLILFGGGVIEAVGDLFLEKILSEVDRYCMPAIRSTVDIKNASLGDDSILYGDLAMIKGL